MGNLTEFFDSDDLELPGSWDTYPGSFEQFIKGIFAKYLAELSAIIPVDYVSNRVRSESATAKTLCLEIEKCLAEFLLGHPPKAYNVLAQVLQNITPCFKALYTLTDISSVLSHLYRIRSDVRSKLSKGDIFHVPFELRHTVATYRYSIPGLPCLYFGGSIYVCWEECGQPAFDSIHVARFQPAPRSQVQLLDFGWRPAQMAALIDSGRYNKQLSGPSDLSDLVVAHALCWPLLAACSIRVRYRTAHFKPEYIVPQLLLQWITNETKIDGVRYFSTKTSRYFDDPQSIANFAFPVRTSGPTGFCSHLTSNFVMGEPICWPTVKGACPAIGNTPHTNFTLNSTAAPYNQTDFGRLQHCAASLPCGFI